ncbi:MAG: 50S ribosomal protein L11 methyltransferase [Pseudomonadota bacterium]
MNSGDTGAPATVSHYEIHIDADDETAAQALADVLDGSLWLDPVAVAAEEHVPGQWRSSATLLNRPAEMDVTRTLDTAGHEGMTFRIVTIDARDWIAEGLKGLKPVRAGRFVLHGSHDRASVRPNETGLEIDAALAFGTGHHGTTWGCLRLLEAVHRQGKPPTHILDLGTGTGVLAIAAAKLWRNPGTPPILATDMDADSVVAAADNARINGCGRRIRTIRATGTRAEAIMAGAPYDLIVANILARPLMRLAPEVAAIATPGANLILSGLLMSQVPAVRRVYEGHGFAVTARINREGWSSLRLRRS